MIRVLFVCLGNICRSPMAEAVFRDLVEKENLAGKIEIDSSGTGDWHIGAAPHKGTRELLDKQKVPHEGLSARQFHGSDWDDFDYIIAMDDKNISDLKKIYQKNKGFAVRKLMDFVEASEVDNIPDPYFTGDFDHTYELVSKGCKNLFTYIKEKHTI